MRAHLFVVRAVVPDESKRAAFDAWYSREHLPDAVKSFGVTRAWRTWSAIDPAVHQAFYEFPDRASLDAATGGAEMKPLIADFDRDWPGIQRTRDVLMLVERIGD
jgi:hypothetical protein